MIRLQNVSKVFRRAGRTTEALSDVTLEVRQGETLCLVGTSGCGKTTILRLINRLTEPTAGRVLVDGADVATVDPLRLRRCMGYVIQSGGLFPHMTVRQNVGLLCRLEGQAASVVTRRVDELLELVHLSPASFAERFPAELSGGQRQRVGVARALALDPDVLLMDEPFGALDPITRRELQREMQELAGRVSKTIILVTHDIDEAFLLGDRVGVMSGGKLLQIGSFEELRDAPLSEEVANLIREHPRRG